MALAAALIARRKSLGAAVETVKGTLEAIAAPMADTIVFDAKMVPGDIFSDGERRPNMASSGSLSRIRGMQMGTLTFRTYLLDADTFMTLVQACGFEVAGDVATPTSDQGDLETLSFKLWEDGRVKTLAGASGTFTVEAGGAGQMVFVSWTFTGIFDDAADDAMPAETLTSVAGFNARGSLFTIAGVAVPPVDGFSLNVNTDVQPREDITKDSGVLHYLAVPGTPVLTVAPEARAAAAWDSLGTFLAGNAQALSLRLFDGAGNSFVIAGPAAQRVKLDTADRNAKLTDPLDLELHDSTGDDALSLTKGDATTTTAAATTTAATTTGA